MPGRARRSSGPTARPAPRPTGQTKKLTTGRYSLSCVTYQDYPNQKIRLFQAAPSKSGDTYCPLVCIPRGGKCPHLSFSAMPHRAFPRATPLLRTIPEVGSMCPHFSTGQQHPHRLHHDDAREEIASLGLRPKPPESLTPVAPPQGGYDRPQLAVFINKNALYNACDNIREKGSNYLYFSIGYVVKQQHMRGKDEESRKAQSFFFIK